jgi:NAD(P)H-hydrate repair Nnr-like enzyme with NAD(P)H-hydrate dehydratase domain
VTLGQSTEPKEQAIPIELTKASLLPPDGQLNDAIIAFCKERQVRTLVVGPGRTSPFNRTSWEILQRWQQETGAFLVLDAGALIGFWQVTQGLTFTPERTLLTPHLGEWQKMQQGLSTPFAAFYTPEGLAEAHARAVTHGVSIIVKDAAPFIIDPHTTPFFVADFAGPALARAGSGDRLAGLAAAISLSGIPAAKVAALAYALLWSNR